MDEANKKILQYEAAKNIGRAVSEWLKKNEVDEDVAVTAAVIHPTLFVDEMGVSHSGPLTIIDVTIDDDDDEDEY